MKEWAGLALPCPVLYRVHGILATDVEVGDGSKSSRSKQFELAGEDGQQLRCTFMEIDREVAKMKKGERVVVMGRARQDGSIQVKIDDDNGFLHIPPPKRWGSLFVLLPSPGRALKIMFFHYHQLKN